MKPDRSSAVVEEDGKEWENVPSPQASPRACGITPFAHSPLLPSAPARQLQEVRFMRYTHFRRRSMPWDIVLALCFGGLFFAIILVASGGIFLSVVITVLAMVVFGLLQYLVWGRT